MDTADCILNCSKIILIVDQETYLLICFNFRPTIKMTTEPPLANQSSTPGGGSGKGESNTNNNAPKSASNNNANSAKRGGSKSAKRSVPSPITSAKSNPAADNRNMRRIIAEDPEWSLATVPLLTELCVTHIVNNFAGKRSMKGIM